MDAIASLLTTLKPVKLQTPDDRLASVAASIELAVFQLREGRQQSAIEILLEATREASGQPLSPH